MKALNSSSPAESSGYMSAEKDVSWEGLCMATFSGSNACRCLCNHGIPPCSAPQQSLSCRCERWGQVREEVTNARRKRKGNYTSVGLSSSFFLPPHFPCYTRVNHRIHLLSPFLLNAFIELMILSSGRPWVPVSLKLGFAIPCLRLP